MSIINLLTELADKEFTDHGWRSYSRSANCTSPVVAKIIKEATGWDFDPTKGINGISYGWEVYKEYQTTEYKVRIRIYVDAPTKEIGCRVLDYSPIGGSLGFETKEEAELAALDLTIKDLEIQLINLKADRVLTEFKARTAKNVMRGDYPAYGLLGDGTIIEAIG